jgi:CRISPR-associated protein Csb2
VNAFGARHLQLEVLGMHTRASDKLVQRFAGDDVESSVRLFLARFVIDGAGGRRPFPSITDALPLAELMRRALLWQCKHLALRDDSSLADAAIWRLSPAFWGKDPHGQPQVGHQHAFFLPADEDNDGRLDHVTVYASMGFSALEWQALDRLRELRPPERAPLRLLLTGLGKPADFRCPLTEPSRTWLSATPFVATRYPKLRGRKRDRPEDYATPRAFARCVLEQELRRRMELPPVVSISEEAGIGRQGLRPIQFKRFRGKPGDDGRRPAGVFRVTFAEPFAGPLCLGHSCHFGLGLFLPSPDVARETRS